MELRNLISFAKVAELKSFSQAADILGYSQSAVTIQIKQLENELGVPLFDRVAKKIQVTSKGKDLLQYARQIIEMIDHIHSSMHDDDSPSGELIIGVVESLCTSIFPDIVVNCRNYYPDIELIVKIGTTPQLIDMLYRNEVDLILTLDREIEDIQFIIDYKEEVDFHFISSPGNPLTKGTVKLMDMMNESFILPEKVCNCRKILEEKITPFMDPKQLKVFLEIGNSDVIKRFVKEGLGISMLPEMTLKEELEEGSLALIDVEDFHIKVWLQMIYHKDKPRTIILDSITSVIMTTLQKSALLRLP